MTIVLGPDRLRKFADSLQHGPKHGAMSYPATYRELAAAWEADRAEAKEIRQLGMRYMVDLASMTARAERAEAVLEQVQNALLVRDHQHQATKAELEQARALLAELEWCGVDNWLECPWCLGTKAEHYGEPAGHKPDCKLAALLAAASGGDAMTAPAGTAPAPGSNAAIKAGCTCSVQLVSAGGTFAGVIYRYADKARHYFVALNCPVHDPLPDLTMRTRSGAETGGA